MVPIVFSAVFYILLFDLGPLFFLSLYYVSFDIRRRWVSPGPSVSSANKTDRHDIIEILLKVALSTIKQTNKQANSETLIYNTIKELICVIRHIAQVIPDTVPGKSLI
jgi:hypothetical protein